MIVKAADELLERAITNAVLTSDFLLHLDDSSVGWRSAGSA
ncbi:hypothetical protein ALT785_290002 [Alteromonas infernus]